MILIDPLQPEIWYILENKGKEVTGGRFCAILLGGKCAAWEDVNAWTVSVPGNKPEVIEPTPPPVKTTFIAFHIPK